MKENGGKIIFISSLGSRFYNPAYPLGSMKAAMESIVRDCAETLREKKISVNAVCGGIVKTDSFKILRQFWDNIDMFYGGEEALINTFGGLTVESQADDVGG